MSDHETVLRKVIHTCQDWKREAAVNCEAAKDRTDVLVYEAEALAYGNVLAYIALCMAEDES